MNPPKIEESMNRLDQLLKGRSLKDILGQAESQQTTTPTIPTVPLKPSNIPIQHTSYSQNFKVITYLI